MAGCNPKNETSIQVDDTVYAQPVIFDETFEYQVSTDSKNIYNNEEFNISFEYPSNWEIHTDERFVGAVGLRPEGDSNRYIYFDFQAESFEEFESRSEPNPSSLTYFADNKNYPAKKYLGMDSVTYIIEIDGKYVRFGREYHLNQEEIAVMEEILNSFSFSGFYNTI